MASTWQGFYSRYSFAVLAGTLVVFFFGPFLAESPSFVALASRTGLDPLGWFWSGQAQSVQVAVEPAVGGRVVEARQPAAGVTPAPVSSGGWGIVAGVDVPAYSYEGKFLKTLPGLAVIDVAEFRDSTAGELAVCRSTDADPDLKNFVMKVAQLEVGRGALTALPESELALRKKKAALLVEIETVKREMAEGAKARNPYYAAYKAARAAHEAFQQKALDLKNKRDAAAGSAERMEYADQLHAMRGEGTMLYQTYEAESKRFKAWNETNAAGSGQTNDPRLAELSGKLAAVESELGGMKRRVN